MDVGSSRNKKSPRQVWRGDLVFTRVRSAGRKRATDFLIACRNAQSHAESEGDRGPHADEWEHPDDRGGDQRRTYARDDRRERTSCRIDVPKPTRDEVFRLREPNEYRCRRQRECEQSQHVCTLS